MSYSEEDLFHIEQVKARLEAPDAKAGFSFLMTWLDGNPYLFVHPVSRGAFSAIHVSTKRKARKYADCELGFIAAKDHLKWYFRSPGLESGLFNEGLICYFFQGEKTPTSQEITVDLQNRDEALRITQFVDLCITR